MSDGYYGSIEIGGSLPRSKAVELMNALEKDYPAESNVKFEEGVSEEDAVAALTSCRSSSTWLKSDSLYIELCDSEAENGRFRYVEDWCEKNGLSYDRNSDSCGEYDAERIHWRPGMEEAQLCRIGSNGLDQINKDDVLSLIEALESITPGDAPLFISDENEFKRVVAQKYLEDSSIKPVGIMRAWMNSEYPDPPPLPPFKIIS